MGFKQLSGVLDDLRRSAFRRDRAGATDAEILDYYVATRDDAGFEAIIRRHGPMVLGVCRRILRNEADAEDAFQATFLILVRKASTVRPGSIVGNWLYTVARNTALKAKAMNSKRLAKEREAGSRSRLEDSLADSERLHAILDAELSRLPDKYRLAIILCELEGKPIKEAARQLGWPQGTLASRLSRGRTMLARRLARYGPTFATFAIGSPNLLGNLTSPVPTALLKSTVAAALAAEKVMTAGVVSTSVVALTEGMVKAMFIKKLQIATAIMILLSAVIATAGSYGRTAMGQMAPAEDKTPIAPVQALENFAKPEPQKGPADQATLRKGLESRVWTVARVDEEDRIIVINDGPANAALEWGLRSFFNSSAPPKAGFMGLGVKVDKDAEILIDGKPKKLGDLAMTSAELTLQWAPDRFVVTKIKGTTPANQYRYRITAIDPKNQTIEVADVSDTKGFSFGHIPVQKDAKIMMWARIWGIPVRQSITFNDLRVGQWAVLGLDAVSTDQLVIHELYVGNI